MWRSQASRCFVPLATRQQYASNCRAGSRLLRSRLSSSTNSTSSGNAAPQARPPQVARPKPAAPAASDPYAANRGPVSWPSLFLAAVAAASAVAYFKVERERRLEQAMGKIVTSESDGWTPRPDYLAKRKFLKTKFGWFPKEDGFGARECVAASERFFVGGFFWELVKQWGQFLL
jgi:hypothetical protein